MSSPSYQLIILDECPSTQEALKLHLEQNAITQDIAIAALSQPSGKGQGVKKWHHFRDNLAVSFSLKGMEPLTLTALELGVLVVAFFSSHFKIELKLKWPNDILNSQGEKVGGIICHVNSQHKKVIAGLGLNLYPQQIEEKIEFNFSPGFIFPSDRKMNVLNPLLHYIYDHRLESAEQVILKWKNYCDHFQKMVTIIDKEKFSGKFLNIGENGQAILEIAGAPVHFYNGSLVY
jgi:biotin-[acetyl-CoA-carboxylase] ligase BirA-like protein